MTIRLLRILLLCTALLVTSALPAGALGVGAKMGLRSVSGGSTGDAYGIDQEALNLELFADLGLLPLLSVELGGGTFTIDSSGSAAGSELEVSYAVATAKVSLPDLDDIALWAGIGAGYYSLSYSGSLADLLEDDGVAGSHLVAGFGFYPVRPILLFVEARYSIIDGTASDSAGNDLALDGLLLQAGAALSW